MRVKKYQTVFHAGYRHPKTRDVARLSKSVKKNKIRYVTVFFSISKVKQHPWWITVSCMANLLFYKITITTCKPAKAGKFLCGILWSCTAQVLTNQSACCVCVLLFFCMCYFIILNTTCWRWPTGGTWINLLKYP